MDLLLFATLVVTGFVSCAEFGSYAFVHPVLRHRLPPREHLAVEQGLLRTFGRVMPVGMPLTVVLAIALAGVRGGPLAWAAAAAFAAAVTSTLIVNVPINIATGRIDPQHPPAEWDRTRRRWETFQGLRSWLLLAGFVTTCAVATS